MSRIHLLVSKSLFNALLGGAVYYIFDLSLSLLRCGSLEAGLVIPRLANRLDVLIPSSQRFALPTPIQFLELTISIAQLFRPSILSTLDP